MTNRDALIHSLSEHTKESDSYTVDFIACPYIRKDECMNNQRGNEHGTQKYLDTCCECKAEWLEKEW